MIKVILVDDHTMVRKGMRMLLEAYPDIKVVGEAEEGNQASLLVYQTHPDLILMDLSMPEGLDGFSASRKIKNEFPDVEIIVVTMHEEEIYVQQAIQIGIKGYLLKNSHSENLIQAIRDVSKGKWYYRTSVSEEKVKEWAENKSEMQQILTDREKEIVRLTVLGYSNKEIAEKLFISVKTVENHKSHIMTKLNFTTKHELIQFALKNHYFDASFELKE